MASKRIPAVVVVTLLLALHGAAQERRVPGSPSSRRLALVIGNDAYPSMPLRNAGNDAKAMARALEEVGFAVDVVLDANRVSLERAVNGFTNKLQSGDVALFYYSGHGLQIEGLNYLVPVDFAGQDEAEAKFRCYELDLVHEKMVRQGTRLNFVVLDACRDNPFRSTRSGARGLAELRAAARGSFIAFATAPGRTASDNPAESNGLFTKHLVEAIRLPGLSLDQVFNRVREQVDTASGNRQLPWVNSSVIGEFHFRPASPEAARPGAPPGAPPAAPGVSLSDLEAEAATRQRWGAYQSKLAADYERTLRFDARQEVEPQLKAEAWQRFLTEYAADNPYAGDDDSMRKGAEQRLQKWRSAPPTAPVIPAAPPTEPVPDAAGRPMAVFDTTLGRIRIALYKDKAPVTVDNFLKYLRAGHYAGTIFHRVIPNFMIQGGGLGPDMSQRSTRAPIRNEASNGLRNRRGTVAMARTNDPNSATSQFFINLKDNPSLDAGANGAGYCVFGEVIEGMDVVDRIAAVPTTSRGEHQNVPQAPVVISTVRQQ